MLLASIVSKLKFKKVHNVNRINRTNYETENIKSQEYEELRKKF